MFTKRLKDGVLITRCPWRADPNHSPPGTGYLHVLTYLYTHPTYWFTGADGITHAAATRWRVG